MDIPASHPGRGYGGLLAGSALVLLAGALWLGVRRAEHARLSEALAAWTTAPLPERAAPVDTALAALGADAFQAQCAACHSIRGEERLGPDLAGVTLRREYGWIRAMILSPDSMTEADPVARALRERLGLQMLVPGGVEPARARAILEFLRRVDAGAPPEG